MAECYNKGPPVDLRMLRGWIGTLGVVLNEYNELYSYMGPLPFPAIFRVNLAARLPHCATYCTHLLRTTACTVRFDETDLYGEI